MYVCIMIMNNINNMMSFIDKASDSEEVSYVPHARAKAKGKAKGKEVLMIEDHKVIIIIIITVINMSIVFMRITIIIYLTMTDMGYVSINDYITRRLLRMWASSSDLRQPCLVGALSLLAEDGGIVGSSGFAF